MTREEAIAILNHAKGQTEYPHGAYGIALDMAIKALEQEPICPSHGIDCEDCPAYEPCEDAISRVDAEALFRNARSKQWNHIEKLKEIRQEIYKPQQAYALKGLYTESSEDYGIHVGLTMALEVIDKHIAEEQR